VHLIRASSAADLLTAASGLAGRQERLPVGWQMLVQSIEQHGVQRV